MMVDNRHSVNEARIGRLETRFRLLFISVLALPLAAVTGWTALRPNVAEPVRAEAFELVDDAGQVWAVLRLADAGPELILYDSAGVARVSLGHSAEETGLFLRDASGDIRVGVAQFAHGGGGIAIHGPEARGAAVLYRSGGEDGQGSLTFYATDGAVISRTPSQAR